MIILQRADSPFIAPNDGHALLHSINIRDRRTVEMDVAAKLPNGIEDMAGLNATGHDFGQQWLEDKVIFIVDEMYLN